MPERKPPDRRSIRWILYTSLFGPITSFLIFVDRWVHLHKDEPEFPLLLINYTVAWLPFAFSILIAFVPDMRKLHKFWRALVILGGLTYSVILFKQQVLTIEANKRDQQSAIEQAVKQSNQHSDEQITVVRNDVKGVRDDVKSVKEDLGAQVSKSETTLSSSISKVGKPTIPDPPQLKVSLYTPGLTPLLAGSTQLDKDGNFPVEFIFTNVSDTAADTIDVWVSVCESCTFVSEPQGYGKPEGTNEHVRHRIVPVLNPGTSFEKTKLLIKANVPFPNNIQIGFRYSCKNCGKIKDAQIMTVTVLPAS